MTRQDRIEAPETGQKPAERAYETIRAAILSGELSAGAHLREESLARLCGASRTPVREALHRLAAEGLAITENRHRFVADFSLHEVEVIFDIRARMESYAARVAATRITREQLTRLQELVALIDELGDATADADAERYFELNSQFHGVLIDATRSTQLRALTAQAFAVPLVAIKRLVCDQEIDARRSNAQHKDILDALERRDAEWAAAAMMNHIISTKPAILAGERAE